jgi:hypothetical protein
VNIVYNVSPGAPAEQMSIFNYPRPFAPSDRGEAKPARRDYEVEVGLIGSLF